MVDLKCGDCLELMNDIPNESVDLILCDLPYGTTACKWDNVIPFEPLWKQYNRVLKECGTVALFGSEPFSSLLRCSNLEMYKYDWIWEKNNSGNFQLVNEQPLKIHETISVFYKNPPCFVFSNIIVENMKKLNLSFDKVSSLCMSKNGNKTGWLSNKISGKQIPTSEQWNLLCELFCIENKYDELCTMIPKHKYNMELNDVNVVCSNKGKGGTLNHMVSESKRDTYVQYKSGYPKSVLKYKRETGLHPTQKPVALLEYFIKTYTDECDVVLDNTMGSGSTGVACANLNRDFIGIELEDEYFKIAKQRIDEALEQKRKELF